MLVIDSWVESIDILTQAEGWLAAGCAYLHLLAEFAVLIGEAACLGGRLLERIAAGERR